MDKEEVIMTKKVQQLEQNLENKDIETEPRKCSSGPVYN